MQRDRTAWNLPWLGLLAIGVLLPTQATGSTQPGTPTAHTVSATIYRAFLASHRQPAPTARPRFDGGRAHPYAALAIVGLEVSTDTAAGRFQQDEAAVGRFDNGNYLAVWRDRIDGPEKIYGRRFNTDLLPLGPQFDLFGDNLDRAPEGVTVASDGQSMLVGFIDRTVYHVTAAFTDSTGNVQSILVADEIPQPQYLAAPAAARLYPRGFVAVWEEFRGGWRIFGQRFDSAGVKIGANVNIDGGVDSLLRLTPAVAGDTSGGYMTVWSEGNQSRCDVYARVFNAAGTAVGPAFPLTAPAGSESYMLPAVVYVAASDEFWVTYVRTDDPADSTALLYSRLTRAGAFVDSAVALPAGPYPWAPVLAQAGSQVAFYTERFDNLGEIRSLELTFAGSVSDSSTIISDAVVWERQGIAATSGFDSVAVMWQDRETGDYDIRGRLRAGAANATPEFKINQSNTGGQQQNAGVAARQGGGVQVVFTDTQLDDGDISLVDVADDGTILQRRIVNDDGTLAPQYDAHAAGDSAGRVLITWTDERTDWTGPARHAAGRYVQGGSFVGAAFPLSADQTASSRSQTDVSANADGATATVWVDDRSAIALAFMRRFDAAGTPTTGDLGLYDGSQTQIVVALEQDPIVSVDSNGMAWTAWSVLDALTDSFFVFAQAWDTGGTRRGTTQDLSPEGATAAPIGFDIQALSSGDVRLVWYSADTATAGVWIHDFDTAGTAVAAAQRVSDSGVLARTPTISQDVTGRWVVSWSQQNGLYEDIYWQRFDADGTPTASLERISAPINTTRRRDPALAYSGTFLFGVWHDNETPGQGYDVRLSSVIKSAAAVGDDIAIRPDQLELHPNYPNPFNPSTVIAYTLESPAQVNLQIFDVLGRRVRTLVSDVQLPGSYRQMWDGTDNAGHSLGSGVYFYRLRADDVTRTRKMVLLR